MATDQQQRFHEEDDLKRLAALAPTLLSQSQSQSQNGERCDSLFQCVVEGWKERMKGNEAGWL